MNIDTGLIAVIVAVLIFYLRLIILQRESVRRARQAADKANRQAQKGKGKRPATGSSQAPAPNYSILSKNRVDLVIGGAGLLAIVVGTLAYAGTLRLPALQSYWWLPTALGIVAFSWAFKLPEP